MPGKKGSQKDKQKDSKQEITQSLNDFLDKEKALIEPIQQARILCEEAELLATEEQKSALVKYQKAIQLDPENVSALAGVVKITRDMKQDMKFYLEKNKEKKAFLAEYDDQKNFPKDDFLRELAFRGFQKFKKTDYDGANYFFYYILKQQAEADKASPIALLLAEAYLQKLQYDAALRNVAVYLSSLQKDSPKLQRAIDLIKKIEKDKPQTKTNLDLHTLQILNYFNAADYLERAKARPSTDLQRSGVDCLLAIHLSKLGFIHPESEALECRLHAFKLWFFSLTGHGKPKEAASIYQQFEGWFPGAIDKDLKRECSEVMVMESQKIFRVHADVAMVGFENAVDIDPTNPNAYLARFVTFKMLYTEAHDETLKEGYCQRMLQDYPLFEKLASADEIHRTRHIKKEVMNLFLETAREKKDAKQFTTATSILEQAKKVFGSDRFDKELGLVKQAEHPQLKPAVKENTPAKVDSKSEFTSEPVAVVVPSHPKPTINTQPANIAMDEFTDLYSMVEGVHAFEMESARIADAKKVAAELKAFKDKEAIEEKERQERILQSKEAFQQQFTKGSNEAHRRKLYLTPKEQKTTPKPSEKPTLVRAPVNRNPKPVRVVNHSTPIQFNSATAVPPAPKEIKVSLNPKATKRGWGTLPPVPDFPPLSSAKTAAQPADVKLSKKDKTKLTNDKKEIDDALIFLKDQKEAAPKLQEYNSSIITPSLLYKIELAFQLGVNRWSKVVTNPNLIIQNMVKLLNHPQFDFGKFFNLLSTEKLLNEEQWKALTTVFQKNPRLVNQKLSQLITSPGFLVAHFLRDLSSTRMLTSFFPSIAEILNRNLNWISRELVQLQRKNQLSLAAIFAFLLVGAKQNPNCEFDSISRMKEYTNLIDDFFSQNYSIVSSWLGYAFNQWENSQPKENFQKDAKTMTTSAAQATQMAHQNYQPTFFYQYDPTQWQPVIQGGQLMGWLPLNQPVAPSTAAQPTQNRPP